jgi:hypothetical protein
MQIKVTLGNLLIAHFPFRLWFEIFECLNIPSRLLSSGLDYVLCCLQPLLIPTTVSLQLLVPQSSRFSSRAPCISMLLKIIAFSVRLT